jgi:hypothetical protein
VDDYTFIIVPTPATEEAYDADLSRIRWLAIKSVAWLLFASLMVMVGAWQPALIPFSHALAAVMDLERCREPVMPMFYRCRFEEVSCG